MKTLLKQITQETELISYIEILPSKEACMLKDGNKYLTGSDYSEEELNAQVPLHNGAMMEFYKKII